MKFRPAELLNLYAIFLFLFLIFLSAVIFTGFWLGIDISSWTLVFAFMSYIVCIALYLFFKQSGNDKFLSLSLFAALTPLIFWGGIVCFNHTYDTSYDGPFYHETAIIALANKWDPIYKPSFPQTTPQVSSAVFDQGSPKIVWSIDASIYKLTNNLDSATFINLMVSLIALVFIYESLRTLGIKNRLSLLIALAAVFTPIFLDQIFSFREDSLSYNFLLIGVASLVQINKSRHVLIYYACLLSALILLAGSKFSNLYIFLSLIVLGAYLVWRHKLYLNRKIQLLSIGALIAGFIMIFNPIFTNTFDYHAIDYPYNQPVYANSLRETGVPANIRHDSRLELFFYGIFSSSEISNANNPASYAKLKIPFTFTGTELIADSQDISKLVGGYGVLFSGISILSVIAYIYLIIESKSKPNKSIIIWVHIAVVLIVVSCLLIPIPNYARYNSQLYLLPIVMIVALSLISSKDKVLSKLLSAMLLISLVLNFYVDLIPSISIQEASFNLVNSQLSTLKNSHKTYQVYSEIFYPSYTELRAHGININIVKKPLSCHNELYLDFPPATQLCPAG